MLFEGLDKLIAALGAAVAAALTPVGVIYAASVNRKNKATEVTIASLTADIERLEERLADAEKLADAERKSGLKWYQLVLFWFSMSHDMRRFVLDTRQVAENLARNANQPMPQWSAITLPNMEDALATKVRVNEDA